MCCQNLRHPPFGHTSSPPSITGYDDITNKLTPHFHCTVLNYTCSNLPDAHGKQLKIGLSLLMICV
jgi:hypothetical protein